MALPEELRLAALEYHRLPRPGKIKVAATKPMVTQRDLALAYSPGVAYACEAIVEDANAARYDDDHLAGLTSFYQSFGDVRSTDDCINILLNDGD